MTELLPIHPKKTSDVELTRPIANWISSTFGSSDDPVDARSDIEELHKLRQAIARPGDSAENSLSSLCK